MGHMVQTEIRVVWLEDDKNYGFSIAFFVTNWFDQQKVYYVIIN